MKKIVLALTLCLTVIVCASCRSVGRTSIISIEEFKRAMEEYDAEEYDSYSEIEEQFENDRAMLAGMYTVTDHPSMSDKAVRQLEFIQGISGRDGAYKELEAHLLQFETEEDALEFFNENTQDIEVKTSDTIRYGFLVGMTQLRTAEMKAVYTEYDHVLILQGMEYKDNGMPQLLDVICPILYIPTPDMSGVDCNMALKSEDRMPILVDELKATEIDSSEFDLNMEIGEPGCYYIQTDDFISISGVMDKDRMAMFHDVTHIDIFYQLDSDPDDIRATRYVVMRVECDTMEHTQEFYNSMAANIARRDTGRTTELTDSGKKYGVRYYKYKITDPFMSASYNLYFDGEAAYVLSFLNMDEEVAASTMMRITDIMGLP